MEKINKLDLEEAFSKIRLIVTDFDGVWTDNKVIHFEDNKEAIVRSKGDSLGIDLLAQAGVYDKQNYMEGKHDIDIIILSKETNSVVKSVAKKIHVKYVDSVENKHLKLEEEVGRRGLDMSEVIFIGNDFNDIGCIKIAGVGIAVSDAEPYVKSQADYVTRRAGGCGAVREVIELVLRAAGKHPFGGDNI
jgi:YrbI family 3-deoxy-D-manno-octulosonate 8-phosphate phosphatase